MATLDELLQSALAQGADVLILKPGGPPTIGVSGTYRAMPSGPLSGDDIRQLCERVASRGDLARLAESGDAHRTTFVSSTGASFEAVVFGTDGSVRAAFHLMGRPRTAAMPPGMPRPVAPASLPVLTPPPAARVPRRAVSPVLTPLPAKMPQPAGAKPNLDELLDSALAHGANALLLKPGEPPTVRVHGAYCQLQTGPLSADDTRALCAAVVSGEQVEDLAEHDGVHQATYVSSSGAPFDVSVFWWEGGIRAAFRLMADSAALPSKPPPAASQWAPIPLAPPRLPPQGPLGGEGEHAAPADQNDGGPGLAGVGAILSGLVPPRAGHDAKPLPQGPADIEPPREA